MTRTTTRRGALRALAGLSVLAAGGAVWRAQDTGALSASAGPAYAPWDDWREARLSGPLAIVQAGILSANAHNTQPWRFEIAEDAILLFADHDRHLGAFDPFRREMMLSLGCALENMVLAAEAEGYRATLELPPARLHLGGPENREGPVARLALAEAGAAPSEFHAAIAHRHTHRGAYLPDRPVAPALLAEAEALSTDGNLRLFLFTAAVDRARFAEMTVVATARIIADHQMAADSAAWFRFTPQKVAAHRDGITIEGFGLPPLTTALVKMLPVPSDAEADRQWLEATRDLHVATAPLFGMIGVRDLYDKPTALAAGRLWQRLHLWAAARGLAAQPLNQLPEWVDREAELGRQPATAAALADLMGTEAWRPTFAFRMGHAAHPARPSPRRGLDLVASSTASA